MISRVEDAPTFALIGAAGYIAPKHGAAIKAVGGRLVAACDVLDAVGWLDKDWPECRFVRCDPTAVYQPFWWGMDATPDYFVVCSPNDHHLASATSHAFSAGRVICEKPLALTSAGLDELHQASASGWSVYTIMNLRHHPEVLRAKRCAEERRPYDVLVEYFAPRGPWYDVSWKGDTARSGGLIFNVGIHALDALLWMFGPATVLEASTVNARTIAVTLEHKHALYTIIRSKLLLSTDPKADPRRRIKFNWMDGSEERFDLSAAYSLADDPSGHIACYREILAGNGPGIAEARPGIELCERINAAL